jgi:hypothetical protein
MPADG